MPTTTTSPLTADRPRGKNQRERWYQTHARPAEELYVVIWANGRIGLLNGAAAVAEDPAVLQALEDKIRHELEPRWGIARWTFEEGAALTRLTLADVERMA